MSVTQTDIDLWDAINDIVVASGGNPGNTSTARQLAVARVEKAIRQKIEAECDSIAKWLSERKCATLQEQSTVKNWATCIRNHKHRPR